MTAVPQRTALSHAFGALCVTLVGTSEFYLRAPDISPFMMAVLSMEVILGSLTFTGSLMAAGKLQEILPQRPITYKGQNFVNLGLLALSVAVAVFMVFRPDQTEIFHVLLVIPMVFGILMIIPIGGADMPTVISLLNSYAGLSAANRVVIVPGYGMAVAQAQHKVRELYDALTKRGVDVKFGIHPVAGRMPGHMNVLLAEADIPYDKMLDMDEINGDFPQTDVALVIGANDVTNPAARNDPSSPIYGMPILDTDKARTVMVIKRGMSPGFAGIDNPLYYLDKTLMLFGDARAFVGDVVRELAGGGGHGS
jgi:NAD/NADP transhydrogenase beta subunit